MKNTRNSKQTKRQDETLDWGMFKNFADPVLFEEAITKVTVSNTLDSPGILKTLEGYKITAEIICKL